MKNLNELAKQIHENAKAKGFYGVERNEGEIYMLIVSELGEALEAHRKGRFADLAMFLGEQNNIHFEKNGGFVYYFLTHIKDTFEDEIADTIIRILDYVYYKNPGFAITVCNDLPVNEFVSFYIENIGDFLFFITSSLCSAKNNRNRKEKLNELSHIVSCLLSFCNYSKIDIMEHIELKMQYNATREKLHGKAY